MDAHHLASTGGYKMAGGGVYEGQIHRRIRDLEEQVEALKEQNATLLALPPTSADPPTSVADVAAPTTFDASLLQTVETRLEAKIEVSAANAVNAAVQKFEQMIVAHQQEVCTMAKVAHPPTPTRPTGPPRSPANPAPSHNHIDLRPEGHEVDSVADGAPATDQPSPSSRPLSTPVMA